MVVSIQRLAILVLLIDFTIGTMLIFATTGEQASNEITDYTRLKLESYENWSRNYESESLTPTPDSQTVYLNKEITDSVYQGRSIFQLLKDGLPLGKYDSCSQTDPNTDCTIYYVSWISILGVLMFLAVIHILLAVELYFIFINKKVS